MSLSVLVRDDELAGLLDGGQPAEDPRLAGVLAELAEPVCTLAMSRGARTGMGRVGPRLAMLVVPSGEAGTHRLHAIPTEFLPAALARMNDVGPRPGRPRRRVRMAAGELARLLAQRGARGALGDVREHWRIEARWASTETSLGLRIVEVVDSDVGLWLVAPDGAGVELWPATALEVWRMLVGLLPRSDELADG